MKKIFSFLTLLFIGTLAFAQMNNDLKTIKLRNGLSVQGYVETQDDGTVKVTTKTGDQIFFSLNEIGAVTGPGTGSVVTGEKKLTYADGRQLKYCHYNTMYKAKDYVPDWDDEYNVGSIAAASFLLPGLGQYITGCQVGWGVAQTILWLGGLLTGAWGIGCYCDDLAYNYNWRPDDTYLGVGIPFLLICGVGSMLWSGLTAIKAAKIKNMYLRDYKNNVAYNINFSPYVDFTNRTFAMNSSSANPMTLGLSCRISF